MPADTPGKPRTSPRAVALASASRTPNRLRSAAAHRKVGPVLQAGHGEAAPSANQREPRSAQDPPPGRAQERERPPLEAGEGGHPGDDREAPAEPSARARGSRAGRRLRRPEQVPRRLQRVPGRGAPLPGRLRGHPGRRALPPARPPGGLPGPAGSPEPLGAPGPRYGRSHARGLRGPPAAAGFRRPLPHAAP